jgi:glycosyltransferase involved in cell wall biosynthesis
MKRVLMVAYHFPPLRGSSGIQRTLRFAKYLPEFGWEPVVLSAHPRAYEQVGDDQMADIAPGVHVCRAFALDAARHLSIRQRYPGFLGRPDRWRTWWLGAVPAGVNLVRRFAPHALWSTYPIATAHAIGRTLRTLTGLPWVADFRDPMAQEGYPPDPRTWKTFDAVERKVAKRAAAAVFTSPGALRMYQQRYAPQSQRFHLIENGYDEESFEGLGAQDRGPLAPGMLTLLHSGIVYPDERNPAQLFHALRRLLDAGTIGRHDVRVRFRAAVHDTMVRSLAAEAGVADQVEVLPAIAYGAALEEMMRADALLLLQAANCNDQIPAKLYEYFRSSRPIVALTDPAGDTAAAMRAAGCDLVAPLDDAAAIASMLPRLVSEVRSRTARLPDARIVSSQSRRARTAALARLLDSVAGAPA